VGAEGRGRRLGTRFIATTEYWQAGRSVAGIHDVRPAGQVVREFAAVLD
jgi:hypothetical protein